MKKSCYVRVHQVFLGKRVIHAKYFKKNAGKPPLQLGVPRPLWRECFKPPPLPSVLDTWLQDVQRSRVIGAEPSLAPHEPLMPGAGWTAPVARWGSGSPAEHLRLGGETF